MIFKSKISPSFAKKFILCLLFLAFANTNFARTKSNFEIAGDWLQIALPISASAGSICVKDYEGLKQFTFAFSSTLASTYILKYSINRKRPDGTDYSFPSGHTAASFSAASYIHFRYGWRTALPAYLVASYVGYSRIRADRHYPSDVVAGAAIASAFSWFYTTPYIPKSLQISPLVFGNSYGMAIAYSF